MAKLEIKKQRDGTYKLRATRKEGKAIAQRVSADSVKRADIRSEAERLMESIRVVRRVDPIV